MTKATATKELITNVSARALNAGDVDAKPFNKIRAAIKRREPNADALLAAFVGGMATGSEAVARRWIERNPASALAYSFGPEACGKLLKAKVA